MPRLLLLLLLDQWSLTKFLVSFSIVKNAAEKSVFSDEVKAVDLNAKMDKQRVNKQKQLIEQYKVRPARSGFMRRLSRTSTVVSVRVL